MNLSQRRNYFPPKDKRWLYFCEQFRDLKSNSKVDPFPLSPNAAQFCVDDERINIYVKIDPSVKNIFKLFFSFEFISNYYLLV